MTYEEPAEVSDEEEIKEDNYEEERDRVSDFGIKEANKLIEQSKKFKGFERFYLKAIVSIIKIELEDIKVLE